MFMINIVHPKMGFKVKKSKMLFLNHHPIDETIKNLPGYNHLYSFKWAEKKTGYKKLTLINYCKGLKKALKYTKKFIGKQDEWIDEH